MALTEVPGALPPPPGALLHAATLFLDFDGTLVDIADAPDAVIVDPSLLALLTGLARRQAGRLAVVSGRSIAQLDALLGPIARDIALSGSHGSEYRLDGMDEAPPRDSSLDAVEARMRQAAAGQDGVIIESKTFGVALHYRLAPGFAPEAHMIAQSLAREFGLALQEGKMMVEARIPGSDKGTAITRLMRRAPMAGTRPVFIGDDVTDESGFAAARSLGGTGILVGLPRPTAAEFGLPDPTAVRAWLAGAIR